VRLKLYSNGSASLAGSLPAVKLPKMGRLSQGHRRKRGRRPLVPLHPVRPTGPAGSSAPKGPRRKSTRRSCWRQREHLTALGSERTHGPRQDRPPSCQRPGDKSLTRVGREGTRCAVRGTQPTFSPPRTRFARCSGPPAAKSVVANLPECAADMRPARRGADRDNCFAAAPMAALGVLFRRRVRWTNGPAPIKPPACT
jgi:hypothetical protein